MKVVGYQGVSVIDFPGRVATILFTPGCNFLCPCCQNPDLVHPPEDLESFSASDLEDLLVQRRKFIDGVCVTGGEPTMQKDLPEFLAKIRKMGFQTKIDTNGYLPDVLEGLIAEGLVDFVAMDVKTRLERYHEAAGKPVEIARIERSIDLLLASEIEYEFRTTVVPELVEEVDVVAIARRIAGVKSYRLHQFDSRITLDPSLTGVKPYTPQTLEAMAEAAKKFVADTAVRGI